MLGDQGDTVGGCRIPVALTGSALKLRKRARPRLPSGQAYNFMGEAVSGAVEGKALEWQELPRDPKHTKPKRQDQERFAKPVGPARQRGDNCTRAHAIEEEPDQPGPIFDHEAFGTLGHQFHCLTIAQVRRALGSPALASCLTYANSGMCSI